MTMYILSLIFSSLSFHTRLFLLDHQWQIPAILGPRDIVVIAFSSGIC